MLKIGLTGGIGSGKTIVSHIFAVLGIPVFYADDTAKSIMNEDAELRQSIITLFGADAYQKKLINRKYIADIVFNDAEKLNQLNALIHPATIAAADAWMQQQTTPYVIKEAALLFEANAAINLDYVIGVHAPEELRIKRVADRDNIARADILARIAKQMDESAKMQRCNFVIINDEKQAILPQVLLLHQKLLSLS